MKRILSMLLAALMLLAIANVHAESDRAETVWTTTLTARFATVEEGQQLMRERTLFHEQINAGALEFFLQKKGGTLEEYIDYSADQVKPFTPWEAQKITDVMNWLHDQLEKYGLKLPDPGPITFVKSTGQEAAGATGYTSGGAVFISQFALLFYPEDMMRTLVLHEISHYLSRLFPEYREALYALIHFTLLDQEIELPGEIREQIIANPDVEHHNSYATFTIDGEKKDCYLVFLTDSAFEKAGDSFFDGMYSGVVPLDGSRVYRVDEVDDFWDVVGRNTDYVEDPEELMASNFASAIVHLDDGYDGFKSPEILEGIIDFLKK